MAQRVHTTRRRILPNSTLTLRRDPANEDSFFVYDGLHRVAAGRKVRVAACLFALAAGLFALALSALTAFISFTRTRC